jgi:hypothetical protein
MSTKLSKKGDAILHYGQIPSTIPSPNNALNRAQITKVDARDARDAIVLLLKRKGKS